MPDRLPDFVDPTGLADRRSRLVGKIPLRRLDRLVDILADQNGSVSVELLFGRKGRTITITGQVVAELILQCQSCLEPMKLPVDCQVSLGVVGSLDEENLLAETLEPIMVEPGAEISIPDIVQDELILAVPVVPRHSDCNLYNERGLVIDRPHPFAELAKLKKN